VPTPDEATLFAQYEEAVAYLDSLLKMRTSTPGSYDRDVHLSRERMLLRRWGDPHLAYPTAHITGTSGKGSTATMLASILQAAGHHTGLHTSPYLQAYTEKIRIGDAYLAIPTFAALVTGLRAHVAALIADGTHGPPTYFEATVALAFIAFARAGVDVSVIEVGVGGRHDATNVITPRVSVITNVGYDHVATLGPTLADIAFQKAGIVKPGVPTVTAVTVPEAYRVVRFECEAYGAPLTIVVVGDAPSPAPVAETMRATIYDLDINGAAFSLMHGDWRLDDLHIALLGAHQVTNAATAVAAARALDARGIAVSDDAIRVGLARAFLPGRLEVLRRLPGEPTVIVDGAHNPDKARSLVAALGALFPGRRVTLLLGMVADKDTGAVLDVLLPAAAQVVTTQVSLSHRPTAVPDTLAETIRARGVSVTAVPDVAEAIATALALAGPDGIVCVTGSLYLVGAVRRRWISDHTVAVRATSLLPLLP